MIEIVEQSFRMIAPPAASWAVRHIEAAAKVSHDSEFAKTPAEAEDFIKRLISWGHESPLEHVSLTVFMTTDRGISHEIVRHRLASYTQASTRYIRHDPLEIIVPLGLKEEEQRAIMGAAEAAASAYKAMIDGGTAPEIARAVLPTCTATRLYMTANIREWRHFFKLRTSRAAHPQMRRLAKDIFRAFREWCPCFFEDLEGC